MDVNGIFGILEHFIVFYSLVILFQEFLLLLYILHMDEYFYSTLIDISFIGICKRCNYIMC